MGVEWKLFKCSPASVRRHDEAKVRSESQPTVGAHMLARKECASQVKQRIRAGDPSGSHLCVKSVSFQSIALAPIAKEQHQVSQHACRSADFGWIDGTVLGSCLAEVWQHGLAHNARGDLCIVYARRTPQFSEVEQRRRVRGRPLARVHLVQLDCVRKHLKGV